MDFLSMYLRYMYQHTPYTYIWRSKYDKNCAFKSFTERQVISTTCVVFSKVYTYTHCQLFYNCNPL